MLVGDLNGFGEFKPISLKKPKKTAEICDLTANQFIYMEKAKDPNIWRVDARLVAHAQLQNLCFVQLIYLIWLKGKKWHKQRH